jgi:hypothetical protein
MNKAKLNKAIRLGRRIPLGKKTPEKKRAVHKYFVAVKEMLNG